MAIYSLSITPASRGNGKNAVAMAAYRAGQRLVNQLTCEVKNYTRKIGVLFSEILLPVKAEVSREELWNMAEGIEKRKDARVAREILIALPHELDQDERKKLVRDFAKSLVDKYHIAVDYSIHAPSREGDQRNFHAHLMLTTRQFTLKDALGEKSDLERSDKYLAQHGKPSGKMQVLEIRKSWEEFCNLALQRNGIDEQITAKSNQARGLEKEPMIHIGPTAAAMERKGIQTDRGNINREIREFNLQLAIKKGIERLRSAAKIITDKILEMTMKQELSFSDRTLLTASELLEKTCNRNGKKDKNFERESLSASELLERSMIHQPIQNIKNSEPQLTAKELWEAVNNQTRSEKQCNKNGLDR